MVSVGDRVLQGKDGIYGYAVCTKRVSTSRIDVVFENTNGVRLGCNIGDFTRGALKDYFYPSMYGIGYLGELYAYKLSKDFDKSIQSRWNDMIRRVACTDVNVDNSRMSKCYLATCSDDFKNFSKFVDWVYSCDNFSDLLEFSKITGVAYCLDKDILVKNNKHYSAETCSLVPAPINNLIDFSNTRRGSYPLGVKLHSGGVAVYVMFGRDILGLPRYAKIFNFKKCNINPNKDYYIALADKFYSHYGLSVAQYQKCAIGMAFEDFCIEKKKYMKDVANLYKNYELNGKIYNLLSNEAYNSIINWEFDISD